LVTFYQTLGAAYWTGVTGNVPNQVNFNDVYPQAVEAALSGLDFEDNRSLTLLELFPEYNSTVWDYLEENLNYNSLYKL